MAKPFEFLDNKGNPIAQANSAGDLLRECEHHRPEAARHLKQGDIAKWLADADSPEISALASVVTSKSGLTDDKRLARFIDRALYWYDGVTLSGKVIDQSKADLEGVEVVATVHEPDGSAVKLPPKRTVGGTYEFKNIPRGVPVEIHFEREPTTPDKRKWKPVLETPLFIQAYKDESLPERQYREKGYHIGGKVERDSGRTTFVPFADLEVQLLNAERTTVIDRAKTGADGRFDFWKAADGLLWLKFPSEGVHQGDVFTLSPPWIQIVVPAGTSYRHPVPIRYSAATTEVVGQVSVGGRGYKGLGIKLRRKSDGTVNEQTSDDLGLYRFAGVMPGTYELRFPETFTDSTGQTWELEQNDAFSQTIEVAGNQVVQAQPVSYRPEKHLLRWRVTVAGNPAPGKLVELRGKDDKLVERRRTDDNGYADFDLPQGGDFIIQVYDDERYAVGPIKREISVHSVQEGSTDLPPSPRAQSSPAQSSDGMGTPPSKFDELTSFPLLTESRGTTPSTPSAIRGVLTSGPLGQVVEGAIQQVLGWKPRTDDPKGFVGALNQSFKAMEVDGARQFTWLPRTYAVQTDLSGGLTGAQASLFSRAQNAIDQMLPLLDDLQALRVDVDEENLDALRSLVRSQITELVNELGAAGGPRVARVDQLFNVLLGPAAFQSLPEMDPDKVGGQVGVLRGILGMEGGKVNTVDEEQNLTNFRILVDYLTSLRQSWIANRQFFERPTSKPFFGTQLVLLSRQLSVVAESVDELRATMDSVFIGDAERQTLRINFPNSVTLPDKTTEPAATNTMFIEELLSWVSTFASSEGPNLIQEGGKYGVQFSFLPTAKMLRNLVSGAKQPQNMDIPNGYQTARVQRALQELAIHLHELVNLAIKIEAPTTFR